MKDDDESWTRREFLKALAALGASAALPPLRTVAFQPDTPPYALALDDHTWAIGNDLVEQRVRFSGGLATISLLHKTSGRDWCSLVSSPVFFLKEEDAALDSASGWTFTVAELSASSDEASLTLSVQHISRPIRVRAFFHVWADAPIVRVWTEYENAGPVARRLQNQSFANLVLNPIGNLEAVWVGPFSWLPAYTNDAFTVHRETLTNGGQRRLVIGPYAADDAISTGNPIVYRPSCGWFVFHRPSIGAGLFCGVEWSGGCDARLALNGSGSGEIGIQHWEAAFEHLTAPGERVASPVAFAGLFDGVLDEATALTHQLVNRHYARRATPSIHLPPDAEFPYVMADTWGYGSNINEAGLRPFIDRAAEIGLELVTIDEGWETRIGDWQSDAARFPSGLRATVDYIHGWGMGAGLWLAFANVDPESAVAQAHPDWLATQGGQPLPGSFDTHVLCLSHLPARQWIAAEIDRLVDEYDIDWIVQDFETIARCDNPNHSHQTSDGEFRNALSLWDLIAGVRARHPHLMIENNWSGGRVLDFGMLQLYDAALCDDYNQAARSRGAAFGATHFLPPTWVSKYMGAETLPFNYRTRSFFFGGPWTLMIDLLTEDAQSLTGAVRAYKDLRPMLRDGRVYHLMAPSFAGSGWTRHQISWDALQVVEVGANRAVVLIGRGLGGPTTYRIYPRGLDPAIEYDAIASSGAAYGRRSGAALMADGIEVSLLEQSHEIIVLTQLTHTVFLPAAFRGRD